MCGQMPADFGAWPLDHLWTEDKELGKYVNCQGCIIERDRLKAVKEHREPTSEVLFDVHPR